MSTGILSGLKPAPGSGFRHLRPDEQAALLLVSDIDPFGMVLVDAEGRDAFMLIMGHGKEWLFDLRTHVVQPL